MTAGVGQVEGTDKRDCYQEQDGGEKGDDDHYDLLKCWRMELHVARQIYAVYFQQVTERGVCREVAKNGQLWATAHSNPVLKLVS